VELDILKLLRLMSMYIVISVKLWLVYSLPHGQHSFNFTFMASGILIEEKVILTPRGILPTFQILRFGKRGKQGILLSVHLGP